MKNRLQFRYHGDIFFNREHAYEYLTETINNKHDERSFSSLIAEPLVAYYADSNGDTQALFMIGVNGNGEQPVTENTNYFILDGAKLNEDITDLQNKFSLDHDKVATLEKAIAEEIERAKKKEQELETSVNRLIRNMESETEARRNIDGQVGPKYSPNLGTTMDPIRYIADATSLNSADILLDKAIQTIDAKLVANVNVNGVDGVVKNNVASVVIGGKDILLSDYTVGVNSHPITKTDNINSAFGKVQVQIDTTQNGAGLNEDGTYKRNTSAKYINNAKSVHEATEILDEAIEKLYGGETVEGIDTIHKIGYAIQKEVSNRVSADEKLTEAVNQIKTDIATVNTYTVNNKFIKNNPVLNGSDIKLDNYIAAASIADVTPTDTVNMGLGKLETRIKTAQSNIEHEITRATNAEAVLNEEVSKLQESVIDLESSKIINTDGSVTLKSKNGNTDLSVRIAENDNALKLGVNGLYVDKSLMTTYSAENAIVIDMPDVNNNRKVSLKINSYDKVLVNDGAGLRADISMSYEKDSQRIRLYGRSVDGNPIVVSEINVSDFIADSMIEDVTYNKEKSILTITWNTVSGQKPVEIDFSDLIDVYSAGNGLMLDNNNKFQVVIDEVNCDKIDNIPVLLSTANGLKVVGIVSSIDKLTANVNNTVTLITTEANRAKGVETGLQDAINAEVTRAKENEQTLQTNINAETVAREYADAIFTKDVTEIKSTLNTINESVVKNNVAISELSANLNVSISDLTNDVKNNTTAIATLNGEYNQDGSVKHMILDSLFASYVTPTDDILPNQTLLRHIAGTNKVYASNNTKDMLHNEEKLSDVIVELQEKVKENEETIETLSKECATLRAEMDEAKALIAELKEKVDNNNAVLEEEIVNILLKTIVGTDDEIKVTEYTDPEDGSSKVKIGFEDDAIFNATTNQ